MNRNRPSVDFRGNISGILASELEIKRLNPCPSITDVVALETRLPCMTNLRVLAGRNLKDVQLETGNRSDASRQRKWKKRLRCMMCRF